MHHLLPLPTYMSASILDMLLYVIVLCVMIVVLVHFVVPTDVGDLDEDLPLQVSVSAAA